MKLKESLKNLQLRATLTTENKLELAKLAQPLLTEDEYLSLIHKQFNRGLVGESIFKQLINCNFKNNNITGHDILINGEWYEFKYLGCGSKPSITETVRLSTETVAEFADRILNKYHATDTKGFIFYLNNDFIFNRLDWYFVSFKEVKKIIIGENPAIGEKVKLQSKNRVYRIII